MTSREARRLEPGDVVRRKGHREALNVAKVCPYRGSMGECHLFLHTSGHPCEGPYLPRELELVPSEREEGLRCERLEGRRLRISNLPPTTPCGLKIPATVTIYVDQADDEGSPLRNAIALDEVIIPAIMRALNKEDA